MNYLMKLNYSIFLLTIIFNYWINSITSEPIGEVEIGNGHCNFTLTKSIPYTFETAVTKMKTILTDCGVKKCTKNVPYTVTQKEKKYREQIYYKRNCCTGYYQQGSNCKPICDQACEHSDCVSPNICKCHEGYNQMSPFRCVPHCETCKHGVCVAPENCKCNANYNKNTESGLCEPVCTEECINANCTLPDTCSCHVGFEQDPDKNNVCNPVCVEPCGEHAQCIAPNRCECEPGYKHDGVTCHPICDLCENGVCESPGNCVCDATMRRTTITNNGVTGIRCEPICDPGCINGTCIALNQCKCDEGYSNNIEIKHICEPVCVKSCINSDCITPDVCSCHPGFVAESDFKCVPHCDDCVFGVCVAPGKCECADGYEMNAQTGKCTPICEPACINGECTVPGVCSCHEGYGVNLNETNSCSPVCSSDCGAGGECIGPDLCSCGHGYRLEDNTCIPFCEICEMGECTAPWTCQCHPGYSPTDIIIGRFKGTRCEPLCQPPCESGKCSSPNICSCDDGYAPNAVSKHICNPICDPPCINGECYAPDKCLCDEFYYKKTNDSNECYSCNRTCLVNENCHVPPGCPCEPNTVYNSEKQICETLCDGKPCDYYHKEVKKCIVECVNGECDFDHCLCWPGYHESDILNKCEPSCGDPYDDMNTGCIHGKCVLPGTCQCFDGYQLGADDNFTCTRIEPIPSDSKEIIWASPGLNLYLILLLVGVILVLVCVAIIYQVFKKPKPVSKKQNDTLQENQDFFSSPYFIKESVKNSSSSECDRFL